MPSSLNTTTSSSICYFAALLTIAALPAPLPFVEAFSTVDGSTAATTTASGKTNKKQRAATVAVAALGLSSSSGNGGGSGGDNSNNSNPFRGTWNSRRQRQRHQMHS